MIAPFPIKNKIFPTSVAEEDECKFAQQAMIFSRLSLYNANDPWQMPHMESTNAGLIRSHFFPRWNFITPSAGETG